jgi:GAF domain-containing protein
MTDPQRSEARIETVLSQLSHAANLGISPEELLKRAMDGLLQVTRAPAGLACLADPEGKTLEIVSIRGMRPAVAQALPQAFRLEVARGSAYVTRPIRIGEGAFPGLEELHARLSAEGITAGVLLPLSSDGRLLGLLMAMFRTGGEPSSLADAALETLQRQLSTALQNARFRQSLQSTNTDLLRLLTLAKILAEPRELENTLTIVAQAAKSFSGAVATAVWLADPVAKSLRRIVLLAPEGPERFRPTQFAYGEGIAGWVAANGEVLHVEDPLTDPRVVSKKWAQSLGIRSMYGFPLRFGEALVGVLSVGTSALLPAPQLSLFGTFCDHAALAIGQARLLRNEEVHAEQLGSLVRAAQTVNAGRPRGAVLGVIAEACRRATGAIWFAVWRAEGKTRKLSLLYADPPERQTPVRPRRISYGVGLAGWSALHRRARVTADVGLDPAAADLDWYKQRGIQASAALPLLAAGKLRGVLELGTAASLAAEQLRLAEGYAALTAACLAHSPRKGGGRPTRT